MDKPEPVTNLFGSLPVYDVPTEQKPVAWRFDQAKYRENDLRGRQWAFNVFSQSKPYMDEMVRNVTPLYTAPPQYEVPEGYALIGIDALKAWGVYEQVSEACNYSLKEKNI